MKILTRHLYIRIFTAFLFGFIAFSSLMLVGDMFSSMGDFVQNKAPLTWILEYYGAFIPKILWWTLPATVLFSSLYVLLQLGRTAELTAMLACGVSLWTIFIPFLVLAVLCTGVLYTVTLGPGAKAKAWREAIMDKIRGNMDSENIKRGQVYQNRGSGRIWYLQSINLATGEAEDVEILQSDEVGHDEVKYFASHASWKDGAWTLTNVHVLHFNSNGGVPREENLNQFYQPTWKEKPLDMVILQISPEQLSFKELKEETNRFSWQSEVIQAPYRTQMLELCLYPLSVIVLVLFALVDGASHYRRNAAAGVFNAIFVLITFYLVQQISFWMGSGGRLPASVATAFPLFFFLLVGVLRLGPKFGWHPFKFLRTLLKMGGIFGRD